MKKAIAITLAAAGVIFICANKRVKRKEYWDINGLGPNQVPMFKKFIRESGVINKNLDTLELFDIAEIYGWESNLVWGLIIANLTYNNQFKWYVNNLEPGIFYERSVISELFIADGVKKE